jgi:ATP-dependent exoDNAse (exonuclease V) beta subunit
MANHTKETIGLIRDCGVAATNELVHRIEKRLPELVCLDDSQQHEITLFQITQAQIGSLLHRRQAISRLLYILSKSVRTKGLWDNNLLYSV